MVSGIQLLDLLKLDFIIFIREQIGVFEHTLRHHNASDDGHVFNSTEQLGRPIANSSIL